MGATEGSQKIQLRKIVHDEETLQHFAAPLWNGHARARYLHARVRFERVQRLRT